MDRPRGRGDRSRGRGRGGDRGRGRGGESRDGHTRILDSESDTPGKILVAGIPKNDSFKEKDLEEHFLPFGRITEVLVVSDRKSGKPRGFGFVTYENPSDAKDAIKAMEGKEIGGDKPIHCEQAKIGLKRRIENTQSNGAASDRGRGTPRGRGRSSRPMRSRGGPRGRGGFMNERFEESDGFGPRYDDFQDPEMFDGPPRGYGRGGPRGFRGGRGRGREEMMDTRFEEEYFDEYDGFSHPRGGNSRGHPSSRGRGSGPMGRKTLLPAPAHEYDEFGYEEEYRYEGRPQRPEYGREGPLPRRMEARGRLQREPVPRARGSLLPPPEAEDDYGYMEERMMNRREGPPMRGAGPADYPEDVYEERRPARPFREPLLSQQPSARERMPREGAAPRRPLLGQGEEVFYDEPPVERYSEAHSSLDRYQEAYSSRPAPRENSYIGEGDHGRRPPPRRIIGDYVEGRPGEFLEARAPQPPPRRAEAPRDRFGPEGGDMFSPYSQRMDREADNSSIMRRKRPMMYEEAIEDEMPPSLGIQRREAEMYRAKRERMERENFF